MAFPAAIAASLREQAKYDSELADIEQAGVGEWGRRVGRGRASWACLKGKPW